MPVTKRPFLAALTCATRGWREHDASPGAPSFALQWRFLEGQEVQRRAREWLGEGTLLPSGRRSAALEHTAAALADPDQPLLFEASFSADGCVARADALRRTGDGWELIEIKSATLKPDADPKPDHIDDIGYTVAVARVAGVRVERATLAMVNAEYVEGGSEPFIRTIDVSEAVLSRAAEFEAILPEVAAALEGELPTPTTIYQCRHCDFFAGSCVGVGIPDPLFDLPGLREPRWEKLRPAERISDLPPDADLTDNQAAYVEVLRSGVPRLDHEVLGRLDEVRYPLLYLDFEAIAPAVPRFPGTAPYQTAPFQYSLHLRAEPGAELGHREYLAPVDRDWRRELAERLLGALGSQGSVVVYSSYEKQVLRQLGRWFPDLEPALDAVARRLFDLEKIVRKGYLHPGFRGKSSIKKVLPVIAPGLDHGELAITGGEDAAGIFGLMWTGQEDPRRFDEHRRNLLEYCRLDTLAMVRVHEALEAVRQAER